MDPPAVTGDHYPEPLSADEPPPPQEPQAEEKEIHLDHVQRTDDPSALSAAHASLERIPDEPVFDGTEKAAVDAVKADHVSPGNEKSQFAPFEFARKGVDWPEKAAALKSFVKERGVVVTNALRRLSDKMEDLGFSIDDSHDTRNTEDQVSLEREDEGPKMKGRITFFSKSGCQDCRSVRSLLRKKGVSFVEVNVDVFPQRKLELEERTGTASVPQVFFNDLFVGGIDELNASEDKKELDERVKEVYDNECPPSAPLAPIYGEDEPLNLKLDEFAEVFAKLKDKVQVKDRFYKMRLFSKCFPSAMALEVFTDDQYCEKEEGVEYGRKVAAKHFFHHVLQENLFEDGNHLYRFLEHDPVVTSKCFNFTGAINIHEPLPCKEIEAILRKYCLAITDSFVSDDGKHVDYARISTSEEFRRYVKMTEELHRFDTTSFTREEKLAFFINLYNIMSIHAIIMTGHPDGPLDRRRLFGDFQYLVGGFPYSLSAIQNGILRGNRRPPYQLTKPFGPKGNRLLVALPEPEPLIHFALTSASRSSPALKCYSPGDIDAELRAAVRAFFLDGGVVIDMDAKIIHLSKIIKWYSVDFGKNELEILRWLVNHLEPNKADNLLELLDGNQFKIVYQNYDWALNL